MRRRLPQLLVVLALLGATAAAFALTERLKLEKSPITATRVDKVFSPICECTRNVAVISFRLRKRARVTVDLLAATGEPVRKLVRDRREQAGRVSYTWDGRDNAGRIVPEGRYRPRVLLKEHGRTIVLPNRIRVDTTPPTIRFTRVFPRVFTPAGGGRRDRVTAWYSINEQARAMMLVDGQRRVLSKFRATEGRLVWFGLIDGRAVPPATYELRLRAFDRAGNRSARTRSIPVRVRYAELARDEVAARAGRRFVVRVLTDAVSYRWLFDGRRGTSRTKTLVLRAPDEPGSYALYVIVGKHADRSEIMVEQAG